MRAKLSVLAVYAAAAAALALFGGAATEAGSPKSQILRTKHDFTVSSGNELRAETEDASCVFCHTPHNAVPNEALWNHTSSTSTYETYHSSTMDSSAPSGMDESSKMCMSCHDGTIALGDTVNNGSIQFMQGTAARVTGAANIAEGAGMADDHPIGVTPVVGAEMRDPHAGDPVRLDGSGKVQCTTCHDPHAQNNDTVTRKFLVKSNERSALCLTCHVPTGWEGASHRQPADPSHDIRYTASQGAHTGYTGVANNGCESCHRPHSGGSPERLLKFAEENTCYRCHNGSVADPSLNLQAEFETKVYRHPVSTTPSVHDPAEGPTSSAHRLPETSPGAERHAECADCHNSHASNGSPATPPAATGALFGVSGVASSGAGVPTSQFEYQVCLKCHGDSANKPQALNPLAGNGYGRNAVRQTDVNNAGAFNTRLEFTSTVSSHPVVTARGLSTGYDGEVPSLRPAPVGVNGAALPGRTLSSGSLIYCMDCHSGDGGASGPHASNVEHLLERGYATNVPPARPGDPLGTVPYSPAAYAMCDKCHDVGGSVLQNQSFAWHSRHVVTAGLACSSCHDAHGINGGNASENSSLINFDLSLVGPDTKTGLLRYRDLGFRKGECALTCHGVAHSPASY